MLANLFCVDVTLEDSELVTKFIVVHTSQETAAGSSMGHKNYMISTVWMHKKLTSLKRSMENYLNKPVSFLLIIRDAACKTLNDICVQKVQRGYPPSCLGLESTPWQDSYER